LSQGVPKFIEFIQSSAAEANIVHSIHDNSMSSDLRLQQLWPNWQHHQNLKLEMWYQIHLSNSFFEFGPGLLKPKTLLSSGCEWKI